MTAVIVQITDWARPHVGRRLHRVKSRTRIDTQLRKMGLISGRGRSMQRHKPFVVTPNGEDYILQADWHRPLCDGEVLLVISAPPAGGNGGSSTRNDRSLRPTLLRRPQPSCRHARRRRWRYSPIRPASRCAALMH